MDHLNGFIDHIIFSSEETGFTVARLKIPKHFEPITIVGSMPEAQSGESINCQGIWKQHPKHGKQFIVQNYKLTAPTDLIGIQKYLESGMIKGIGPAYAKRIIDVFGIKTLEIIDHEPKRLLEVPGIGKRRAQTIAHYWNEQRTIRDVMIFLQSHNISPSLAHKIFKAYGKASIEIVTHNPYRLAQEIHGIGFKTIDTLAPSLNIALDSPFRIRSGIEYVLWELTHEGHVCYPKEAFLPKVGKMLELDEELIAKQMHYLEEEQRIAQSTIEGQAFIWIKPLYVAEKGVVKELKRILNAPCNIRPIIVKEAIKWIQKKENIHFAQEQQNAIANSLDQKIHIITGGPGTGKSTITRAILNITFKITNKIILAAPTGRAAKRMSEICQKKAFTIHSLLEMDLRQGGFKRNKENPLNTHLLIIDESSMIDIQLMYYILKATPDTTRIIFIGDIDQLPSVGPGNVLKDLIASKIIPVTRLKYIFRQGQHSRIVANAHRINAGYIPELLPQKGSDFIFFDIEDPEAILQKILELMTHHIPQHFGFNAIDDIQVLSPMKRGIIGTDNLNHILQKTLNPQTLHLFRMGRLFNFNDKVMQIRNNYDKKVYNGDIGRITHIDLENQKLLVNFDRREIAYDFCDIDELMLAYAVSVHKYQGSESTCVIIPVHISHFKLLFRNLLYTGITRGKKLVILLGTKKALAIAVKTDNVKVRYTGLKCFLQN